MKKFRSWRKRRDERFRTMFAECFADWHDVHDVTKKFGLFGSPLYWSLRAPKEPKAKHPDYKALEVRLKAVEQRVCDHVFAAPLAGCLESIFCSKCGVLSPDWEKAQPKPYDDDELEDWVAPEVYADGVGYVRKTKVRKR